VLVYVHRSITYTNKVVGDAIFAKLFLDRQGRILELRDPN